MKIIKPGTIPIVWYYNIINTCGRCGARYQLEPGDRLKHGDDQRDGRWVESKCPTCGYGVSSGPEADKA